MGVYIDVFATGAIQANCVLLGDDTTSELAVIDPGGEGERIVERIAHSGMAPRMILHTHGHLDHAGGTAELLELLGGDLPVGLHRDELPIYSAITTQAMMFGLEVDEAPPPTMWLEHGATLKIGTINVEVRHTPGHSPGGVVFVIEPQAPHTVVAGDVLFAGSIGRTDLMGGSFPVLERSIREQLYTLPDETRVICGHGPDTTIGRERSSNPFVRAGDPGDPQLGLR